MFDTQLKEEARQALESRWEKVEEAIKKNREQGVDRPTNGDSPRPEDIIESMKAQVGHPMSMDVTLARLLFETIVPFQFDPVQNLGNPNLPSIEDPVLIYVNSMQYLRAVEADLVRSPDSVKWSERLDTFTRFGIEGLFHPGTFSRAYFTQLKSAWTVWWNQWLDYVIYSSRTDSPLSEEMAWHLRTGYVDWAAAIAFACGGTPAMRQMSILGRPLAYTASKEMVRESQVGLRNG